VYNLGSGSRIAIWTQGCSRQCPGCISPGLWKGGGGSAVDVAYLIGQVLGIQHTFDGITISGGEPFEQYEPLMEFCFSIKQQTSLDVYVFTGFALQELMFHFPEREFLDCIDYLMDGSYIQEKHEDNNLRGSTNQCFYRIVNGEAVLEKAPAAGKKWSMNMGENGDVFLSGIPGKDDFTKLESRLKKRGIGADFGTSSFQR